MRCKSTFVAVDVAVDTLPPTAYLRFQSQWGFSPMNRDLVLIEDGRRGWSQLPWYEVLEQAECRPRLDGQRWANAQPADADTGSKDEVAARGGRCGKR